MWYCYILKSDNPKFCNFTYNGKTNDLVRRIRQHNQEISGGAKATKNKGPWKYICQITGFSNEIDALRAEWRIKHPKGHPRKRCKMFCGPAGRIKGVNYILNNCQKWTSKCAQNNRLKYAENKLHIKILQKFAHLLDITSCSDWVNLEIVSHF